MKLHIADVHVFREVNSIVDLQKLCNAARHLQCESTPPPGFLTFSPNFWEFLINFLHTYCTFISTLDCKFLFNYLQF